jgi:amino acid adenylation domain-containing protein
MIFLLHHLLEDAARRTPQAEAFRCLERSASYADLDRWSSALAGCLAQQDIGRGDRVGIYLNKSLECAVAIYGVLKSGAAYVPLDPGAPQERLERIVRACDIRCLVTHDARRKGAVALTEMPDSPLAAVIGLTQPLARDLPGWSWDELYRAAPGPCDDAGRTADDTAYVIYTSGSTGEPKGIVHSHSSGLAYARMAADLYGLTPVDRLSNLPPLHFDQSIFDYFSGVAAGACTVIIPEAYAKLPASLSELMQRERLTVWYSVPYALIQLLLHGVLAERDLRALRCVLFGGEPFPPKHLAALMALWPQARFYNVYGPAEVNQCTSHLVPADIGLQGQPAVGRPCPNVELLLVDDADRPVAQGEAGELLIRTPTMMRGYFGTGSPVGDTFYFRSNEDGTEDRFYRSGDLLREDRQGLLHFLGRRDRQVKVRGFRVELDEVEAIMTAHPAVQEAAAVLNPAGEAAVLAVSVTLAEAADCDERALRQYAAQHLPGYAVPERITILTVFPRTTTGKIDRNRLGARAQQPEAQ